MRLGKLLAPAWQRGDRAVPCCGTSPHTACGGTGGTGLPTAMAACVRRSSVGVFSCPFQRAGEVGRGSCQTSPVLGRGGLAWVLQLMLPLSFLVEKRQDNGRVYYVNHNTRTTQWEDPRTQG